MNKAKQERINKQFIKLQRDQKEFNEALGDPEAIADHLLKTRGEKPFWQYSEFKKKKAVKGNAGGKVNILGRV